MSKSVIRVVWLIALLIPGTVRPQGLFSQPEGMTYDPVGDRWFVSNYGDGAIVQIDKQGEQTYFSTYATSALGMHIVGNTLYVASPEGATAGLLGFDLETGSLVVELPFVGMNIPNDLESDTSGFLYVTDWQANRILKVRLSDYGYSVFVPSIPLPNGIVFDRRLNRLLVCCEGEGQARIMAVSLADSSVTVVANAGTGDCDGLTIDGNGHYYFTSWATGSVYQYDPLFVIRRLISNGYSGPASIFFDSLNNVLAIPVLNENRVEFLSFPDVDGDSYLDLNDNCLGEPNPEQIDTDLDRIGDVCDGCTDSDGDGYGDPGFAANTCSADNCPLNYDTDQSDADSDGYGDVCDECTDIDLDGFGNPGFPANTCEVDFCPELHTTSNEDTDSDGIGDNCDNCPNDPNPGQEDTDSDSLGDVCDGCCVSRVGDANGSNEPADEITLGDIMLMVDVKFISGDCSKLTCLKEADVTQDGGANPNCDDHVTLGDIMTLVDFLFISGPDVAVLPECL